jgi:hypothetical protein
MPHGLADDGLHQNAWYATTVGPAAAVATVLAVTATDTLVDLVHRMSTEQMSRVRDLFVSFGTCSVSEPLANLQLLGLVGP